VDAAQPGDTVFVSNGTYYEDVYINKTINLMGISRDNTTINSTNLMGIYVEGADYVNITGFTVVNASWGGIRLRNSNNSLIENNLFDKNDDGMELLNSNNTIISDNIASNSWGGGNGIYIDGCSNFTIVNNTCINNKGDGIWLRGNSDFNFIIKNNSSWNEKGIKLSEGSDFNQVYYNIINNNTGSSPVAAGFTIYESYGNVIYNNSILNNKIGFNWNDELQSNFPNLISNCTIKNSTNYDIRIGNTWGTLVNTSFNKSSVYHRDTVPSGLLTVKWFLHINVIDYLGNPIQNANIQIEDNINGIFNESYITDINGQIKWLSVTEYSERDPDGDTIGNKIYYTPHRIIAWDDTLVGYAHPFIDESKTVTIVLYNGTLMDLEPGWNLVSLPRIQSDTNLPTVLQSIEGQYDAVQWYNLTDTNDPWKHHHISKPSNLNDLDKIDHTMGFWIHITDPGGTTLVVFGDVLTSTQNITLYPGWNHVGYPSLSMKNRTEALNNINFSNDLNAIWTYNATTQKWKEITALDYFEVGRGYWIHAKFKVTWIVPL
jgi:parallel beta-helix repeat protein